MENKFQNRYRIPSARMQSWDYASNGAYFITICTKNRLHYFGEIDRGQFIETEMGQLAEKIWSEIPSQFPFIELDNFVVMPNHIHGILVIDKNKIDVMSGDASVDASVETRLIASLPIQTTKTGDFAGNKNPMFHENISRIIRWYKGRCSFEIRRTHPEFAWQARFHDHIIRNAKSYTTIKNYINHNPLNWEKDKFKAEKSIE